MSETISVPAGERRVVRVFALDMRPEQVRFLREEPGAIADALGDGDLDPDHVVILKISDLEEVGLAGYLTEGSGVEAAEVEAAREKLDALYGHVLILHSRAFHDRPAELHPASRLRLVATFGRPATDWSGPPIETESAKPQARPPSPREARGQSRRIGAIVFAVFVALILLTFAMVLW